MGKPGREPTATRQTEATVALKNVVAGGGSPWRPNAPTGEEGLNRQREPLPTRVGELPPLPDAYGIALEPALAALAAYEVRLDERALVTIADHIRLLLAWNQAINLTSITEPAAVARLHVVDSLAGIPIIHEGPHATVLDLGSGGGFPGITIAAVLSEDRVTLVESVRKKAAFLDAASNATGLEGRVVVLADRGEAVAPGFWDVVTARAVGSLADLVEIALPLLAPGGRLVAWKRGDVGQEMRIASRAAAALGGAVPIWRPYPDSLVRAAGLDGHGVVVVRKVLETPPGFPRDPAARRRRPW